MNNSPKLPEFFSAASLGNMVAAGNYEEAEVCIEAHKDSSVEVKHELAKVVANHLNGAAGRVVMALQFIKAWTFQDVEQEVKKIDWATPRPSQANLDRLELWLAAADWPLELAAQLQKYIWSENRRSEIDTLLEIQNGRVARSTQSLVQCLTYGSRIGAMRGFLTILHSKKWEENPERRQILSDILTHYCGGFGQEISGRAFLPLLRAWIKESQPQEGSEVLVEALEKKQIEIGAEEILAILDEAPAILDNKELQKILIMHSDKNMRINIAKRLSQRRPEGFKR